MLLLASEEALEFCQRTPRAGDEGIAVAILETIVKLEAYADSLWCSEVLGMNIDTWRTAATSGAAQCPAGLYEELCSSHTCSST